MASPPNNNAIKSSVVSLPSVGLKQPSSLYSYIYPAVLLLSYVTSLRALVKNWWKNFPDGTNNNEGVRYLYFCQVQTFFGFFQQFESILRQYFNNTLKKTTLTNHLQKGWGDLKKEIISRGLKKASWATRLGYGVLIYARFFGLIKDICKSGYEAYHAWREAYYTWKDFDTHPAPGTARGKFFQALGKTFILIGQMQYRWLKLGDIPEFPKSPFDIQIKIEKLIELPFFFINLGFQIYTLCKAYEDTCKALKKCSEKIRILRKLCLPKETIMSPFALEPSAQNPGQIFYQPGESMLSSSPLQPATEHPFSLSIKTPTRSPASYQRSLVAEPLLSEEALSEIRRHTSERTQQAVESMRQEMENMRQEIIEIQEENQQLVQATTFIEETGSPEPTGYFSEAKRCELIGYKLIQLAIQFGYASNGILDMFGAFKDLRENDSYHSYRRFISPETREDYQNLKSSIGHTMGTHAKALNKASKEAWQSFAHHYKSTSRSTFRV